MSLYNPSGPFLAFPAPLDVPITQPALGDNIAWNFQDDGAYDYWNTFEGGYDDSWAWEDRKKAPWDEYEGQSKNVLISVKPTTKPSDASAQGRPRRRSKAQQVETSESRPDASQAWDEALQAEHDWLQDPALALDAQGPASASAEPAAAPLDAFADAQMDFDFSDPNLLNNDFLLQPIGAMEAPTQPEMPQVEGLTTFDMGMTAGFDGLDSFADQSWLEGATAPLPTAAPAGVFVDAISGLPDVSMEVDNLNPKFLERTNTHAAALPDFAAPLLTAAPADVFTDTASSPPDVSMEVENLNPKFLERTDTHAVALPDFAAGATAPLPTAASPPGEDDTNRLVTCTTCQKIVKKRKLRDHMRWHSKTRECGICQKSFTTDKDLRRHEKQHTGDKPFKCEVLGCKYADTGFARMDNLRRHVKKIHSEMSP